MSVSALPQSEESPCQKLLHGLFACPAQPAFAVHARLQSQKFLRNHSIDSVWLCCVCDTRDPPSCRRSELLLLHSGVCPAHWPATLLHACTRRRRELLAEPLDRQLLLLLRTCLLIQILRCLYVGGGICLVLLGTGRTHSRHPNKDTAASCGPTAVVQGQHEDYH